MTTVPKIAIIEDDPHIAAMYKFKLEQCGYSVSVAHDGQEGLELISHFRPDIALVDLRMPVMHGDEMLEKARSTKAGSTMRVIILTNISRDEAPQKLRFFNIDRYLVKAHHTPAQVVEVVKEVLNLSK